MSFYAQKKTSDPKWTAGDETHDAALAESGVAVEAVSRIKAAPTTWLVQNVIADEAVTIVAGEPGAGKTFFGCQLAADTARVLKRRAVLAVSGYERPELLRWRLDRADGDSRRVALATLTPKGFNDRRHNPTEELIDERLSILFYTLEAAGDPKSGILPAQINLDCGEKKSPLPDPPRLLVIDDIDGWFGKPGNMLSPAALARVIQRLNELARLKRVAIVVLVRLQLSVEGRITSRQLSRLSHAASVVWMVVRDREKGSGSYTQRVPGVQGSGEGIGDREQGTEGEVRAYSSPLAPREENHHAERDAYGGDECVRPSPNPQPLIPNPSPPAYAQCARRWFLPVKNNLATDAETAGRSFELVDGQIRWHRDDPAPVLAEALLPRVYDTDRRQLRRAAAEWLEEALAAGPVPSDEVYDQALSCGIAKGTLLRAASELGIKSHKTGFKGGWEMRWTPRPEVRGRRSMGHLEPSFRVCGAELAEDRERELMRQGETEAKAEQEASRQGEGETRQQRQGEGETRRQGDGEAKRAQGGNVPSCALSDLSCASSTESGNSSPESRIPSAQPGATSAVTRASSLECGESALVSCDSSPAPDAQVEAEAAPGSGDVAATGGAEDQGGANRTQPGPEHPTEAPERKRAKVRPGHPPPTLIPNPHFPVVDDGSERPARDDNRRDDYVPNVDEPRTARAREAG